MFQSPQPRLEVKVCPTYATANIAGGTTVGTASTVSLINAIITGTDTNNRIGRKLTHRSCNMKVLISQSANCTNGDTGFWAVVLDRQPNGALAAFSDIFDTTPGSTLGLAEKNVKLYQDRFKILAMETWIVGPVGQGDPYRKDRWIDLSKLKGPDATANYNGTGGTIADLNNGALLFVSAQNASSSPQVTVAYNANYRYTDA